MPATGTILDATFLKKLERLSLATKRPFAGQMKGEKRSVKRGTSVEFADYREYALGDDLRYVDWNTAARLEKMFLKLFVEEEDLFLALLPDTSRSMDFGDPKKLHYAIQLAAALGYIGLSNYDRVSVQPYAAALGKPLPTQRGKAGVLPFFAYLEQLKAGGTTSFATALHRFAASVRYKGVAIVFSDFFDPNWQEGLKALLARGFQVAVLHILSEEEIHPTLRGDLRIIDSETGESKEMSVNPQLLTRYQQTFDAFCAEIETFCHRYGIDYLRASTALPVEDLVLKYLRRGGLVK
ncbi:MAG TPA: DUF58 domain-containing protein [Chthonomonadaceae bacterium]|nr:DUF58 domain-containing protein [Chthonomonadaceae bacterium]